MVMIVSSVVLYHQKIQSPAAGHMFWPFSLNKLSDFLSKFSGERNTH